MSQIRIIVGLGNPGAEYRTTRHNVGFMVLDKLADKLGLKWKHDRPRKGDFATGPGILLVKPRTYMNESGACVGPLMRYFKFEPEQVLVIHDDVAFDPGVIKLRATGSAGGQNGVKSLIAHLGSEKFPRIRVGIGAAGSKDMTSHVLGGFSPEEQEPLEKSLEQALLASLCSIKQDFQAAANLYNPKKVKQPRVKKVVETAPKQESPAMPESETSHEPQASTTPS